MTRIMFLLFMYSDICIALGFYAYLFQLKKRVGFQLGMNISITMGGLIALLTGVLLILQYPFNFTLITIVSTLVGVVAGALFGLLFDYQTFVTGMTNGMAIGLMAPMIGLVIEIPSVFVIFIHGLFILCLLTILISIKRA